MGAGLVRALRPALGLPVGPSSPFIAPVFVVVVVVVVTAAAAAAVTSSVPLPLPLPLGLLAFFSTSLAGGVGAADACSTTGASVALLGVVAVVFLAPFAFLSRALFPAFPSVPASTGVLTGDLSSAAFTDWASAA